MTASKPAPATPMRPPRSRQVAAVAAGNALEFYDFVTYAFFAVPIGRTFFPSDEPGASLLASLATFGAGFLTRPLGAWVIGRMGDRRGRKPALLLSFALIGVATVGLPLTPSHAAIGVMAPVLVVLFRLLQGFALGGEVGPSTAYLLEAAPVARRGLFVSMQLMGADAAVLVAGLVGVALAHALTPAELDAWGWRLALLLGGAIVPVGLAWRRGLEETLTPPAPVSLPDDAPTSYRRIAVLALMMLAAATTGGYILEYMTTYASVTLGMDQPRALGATVVIGLCGVIFDPLGGWLSDRIGRRPVMLVPWMTLLVLVFPAFWLLGHERTGLVLYGVTAAMASVSALSTTTVLVAIAEALPARMRSGGLALLYAVAIAVFGGATQFVTAWLIRVTGNPLAPAWYLAVAVAAGLAAIVQMPETAPVRRRPLPGRTAAPVLPPGD